MESAFWGEVEQGFRLPDGITDTFPLANAADVHRLVETGDKVGHYVLVTGASSAKRARGHDYAVGIESVRMRASR